MKVSVEDVSSVKKILHVEVPEEDVKIELDEAYKNLKKNAKVKGFRPGKAPRSVLERLYKKDVHADVTGRLIQTHLLEAIKETELNILGSPEVDPPELDAAAAYKFDATVEIPPELGDIDYKGLEITRTAYGATEEEIDTQLKMLQRNLTRQEAISEERPAAEGDFALVDYEGFADGKPFAETQKTEDVTMKIGDGHVSADFDANLSGMSSGEEKEFTVTFADDYFNLKLAGREITFKALLKEIRHEIKPEIGDEMARQLGKFKSLDELKAEIQKNLQQGYDKRSEQEVNEQIFSALIKRVDFETPETMVKYELDHIVADAERSFSYHNMSMEETGITRESLTEKYRETAQKQVRRHLILTRLIVQEELTVSDEEVQEGLQEMADNYGHPIDEIRNYYDQNKDKLDVFKHSLLEKRAIALILENSTIKEKEAELEADTESEK